MSLLKVIKGLIKEDTKNIDWLEDNPDKIRAKSAYNGALKKISNFLDLYEQGSVPSEFKEMLISKAEEK